GRQAVALQADFRDREAVASFAEAAESRWGHVDVLVNNAGTMEKAMDPRTEGGDFGQHLPLWDEVMDVNLRAPYELTWRLAQGMRQRKAGVVVNVASVAGMYAITDAPLYSLSKAALLHFTRQAAMMYAPHVRVNAVAPGWTETGFGPTHHILDPEFQNPSCATSRCAASRAPRRWPTRSSPWCGSPTSRATRWWWTGGWWRSCAELHRHKPGPEGWGRPW